MRSILSKTSERGWQPTWVGRSHTEGGSAGNREAQYRRERERGGEGERMGWERGRERQNATRYHFYFKPIDFHW